jgi:hypothetical protein
VNAYDNCCKFTGADPTQKKLMRQALVVRKESFLLFFVQNFINQRLSQAKEAELIRKGILPASKAIYQHLLKEDNEFEDCKDQLAHLCRNDANLPKVKEIIQKYPSLLNAVVQSQVSLVSSY